MWTASIGGNFTFSEPAPLAELNTALVEAGPSIRRDGLEIFFFRGSTIFDIFTATRRDSSAPWSTPVRVDALSTDANEQAPRLSNDGRTMFFARTDPVDGLDIWMSTRQKASGKP